MQTERPSKLLFHKQWLLKHNDESSDIQKTVQGTRIPTKKVENRATAALHDKRLPLWIRKVKLNQLHKKGLLMNIESVNN